MTEPVEPASHSQISQPSAAEGGWHVGATALGTQVEAPAGVTSRHAPWRKNALSASRLLTLGLGMRFASPVGMNTYPLLAHSELVSDRTPRPLMAPVLQLDLEQEAAQLRSEWPWDKHGHNARTLLKNPDACLVQISLKAGASIPEQRVGLRLTFQVLSGRLQITTAGSKVTLGKGQLLALEPNVPHALDGQDNSELLLWLHGPQGTQNNAHTQHTG